MGRARGQNEAVAAVAESNPGSFDAVLGARRGVAPGQTHSWQDRRGPIQLNAFTQALANVGEPVGARQAVFRLNRAWPGYRHRRPRYDTRNDKHVANALATLQNEPNGDSSQNDLQELLAITAFTLAWCAEDKSRELEFGQAHLLLSKRLTGISPSGRQIDDSLTLKFLDMSFSDTPAYTTMRLVSTMSNRDQLGPQLAAVRQERQRLEDSLHPSAAADDEDENEGTDADVSATTPDAAAVAPQEPVAPVTFEAAVSQAQRNLEAAALELYPPALAQRGSRAATMVLGRKRARKLRAELGDTFLSRDRSDSLLTVDCWQQTLQTVIDDNMPLADALETQLRDRHRRTPLT